MIETPVDVLLVDDEPEILATLMRTLRRSHFRVRVAENAQSALACIQESTPHIIAADYRMPGMDGLSLLTQVRNTHPDVKSFLLSGEANIPPRFGADFSVLRKPFLPATFRTLLEGIAQDLPRAPL